MFGVFLGPPPPAKKANKQKSNFHADRVPLREETIVFHISVREGGL